MYKLQAILGLISKVLSNVVLVICLPVSLIIFGASIIAWQIQPFLNTIYGAQAGEVIDSINYGGHNVIGIISNTGLGIFIFMLIIYVIFLISLIVKTTLYKSISGFAVARSKELRNIELNKAQERLDNYRYRE